MINILLLVNPFAGLGGSIAAKGSDRLDPEQAVLQGAQPRSEPRTRRFLSTLTALIEPQAVSPDQSKKTHSFTDVKKGYRQENCGLRLEYRFLLDDKVGDSLCKRSGIPESHRLVIDQWPERSTADNSKQLLNKALAMELDLIVFVGGDGTARDIYDVLVEAGVENDIVVLGLPSGVKMHSGCFAISPEAAAELLADMLQGKVLALKTEEVRDIDEVALREGHVNSKFYGELKVPDAMQYMQHTKLGGVENDDLARDDIADWVIDNLEPEIFYFLGAGTTLHAVKTKLHSKDDLTLLGVDCFLDRQLQRSDCTESDLLAYLEKGKCKILLSPTGGQGHVFGRGNQQFSEKVLRHPNLVGFEVLATRNKLSSLNNRPLLIDTNSPELDEHLSGLLTITSGWNDQLVYPASHKYE